MTSGIGGLVLRRKQSVAVCRSLEGLRLGLRSVLVGGALFAGGAAMAQEGTALWGFRTGGSIYGSPSVASDGTIYTGSDDYSLYAIQPGGGLKWVFDHATAPLESAPAIGPDGTVYIGSDDHNVYAINPASGAEKWQYATQSYVFSSPAVGADGTIYFGSYDHTLYAVNPDGTTKWSFRTGSAIYGSPAVGADGTIYVGSLDGSLYAVNPNGTGKWSFATLGYVYGSPSIGADGTVYFGSLDNNLYALSPAGNAKWSFAAGVVDGSPTIGADGTIYVGNTAGVFYAIDPLTGTKKWSFSLNDGEPIYSSAAVRSDGSIIFGTNGDPTNGGHVIALNPNGTLLWNFRTGDAVVSSPAIAPSGVIYAGSYDTKLYAINGNGKGTATSAWPTFQHDFKRSGLSGTAIPANPGRLINLSVLNWAGPSAQILTVGFVSGGAGTSGSQSLLVRATGPALTAFHVADVLAAPMLNLFASGSSAPIATNNSWGVPASNQSAVTAADNATGAFALTNPSSLDAALVEALSPSAYTAQISSSNGSSGNALAEVYDVTPSSSYTLLTPRLVNLSSRINLGAGGIVTAGFVVGGTTPATVLIRAVGPTLGISPFNLPGTMPDPQLSLHTTLNGTDTVVASNAGWSGNPLSSLISKDAASILAFALGAPSGFASNSYDSALLTTLAPGAYTVQLSSTSGQGGTALVEIYEVP